MLKPCGNCLNFFCGLRYGYCTATQRQNHITPVEVGVMKTVWRQVLELRGSAFGGQCSSRRGNVIMALNRTSEELEV